MKVRKRGTALGISGSSGGVCVGPLWTFFFSLYKFFFLNHKYLLIMRFLMNMDVQLECRVLVCRSIWVHLFILS